MPGTEPGRERAPRGSSPTSDGTATRRRPPAAAPQPAVCIGAVLAAALY